MGPARGLQLGDFWTSTESCLELWHALIVVIGDGTSLGVTVNDLLYVGLTIVVFAILVLLVKGVERLER